MCVDIFCINDTDNLTSENDGKILPLPQTPKLSSLKHLSVELIRKITPNNDNKKENINNNNQNKQSNIEKVNSATVTPTASPSNEVILENFENFNLQQETFIQNIDNNNNQTSLQIDDDILQNINIIYTKKKKPE